MIRACRLSPTDGFRNDFPELINPTNLCAGNENSPAGLMFCEAENSGHGQRSREERVDSFRLNQFTWLYTLVSGLIPNEW